MVAAPANNNLHFYAQKLRLGPPPVTFYLWQYSEHYRAILVTDPSRSGRPSNSTLSGPTAPRNLERDSSRLANAVGSHPSESKATTKFRALLSFFSSANSVGDDELANFTRQLVTMLDAGLPLVQSLDFFAAGVAGGNLAVIVQKVVRKVEGGVYLSKALRSYPQVFSPVYVSLIETGEDSGRLVPILHKLAELTERQVNLRQKLIAAATYPVVLMGASILCSAGFIYFILPALAPLITGLGVSLPWPTLVLLALKNLIPWATGGFFAALVLWRACALPREHFFLRNPKYLRAIWRIVFDVPTLGRTLERIMAARVLFALDSMLDAGMSITAALHRCEATADNALMAFRLKGARNEIVDGAGFGEALQKHHVFPAAVIHMIVAGEEGSVLTDMIRRAAALLEEDVQIAIGDLTNAIEPLLMAGIGLVVGFIMVAAMLPIVSLLQNIT